MAEHTQSKLQGREVVIVEAARTPIGRGHPEKGWFRDVHPNELLGAAYTEVIARAGIEPEVVEDVVAGLSRRSASSRTTSPATRGCRLACR